MIYTAKQVLLGLILKCEGNYDEILDMLKRRIDISDYLDENIELIKKIEPLFVCLTDPEYPPIFKTYKCPPLLIFKQTVEVSKHIDAFIKILKKRRNKYECREIPSRVKEALNKIDYSDLSDLYDYYDAGDFVELVVDRWGDTCTYRVYNNGDICEKWTKINY